jgi:hypothetical protein
MNLLARRERFQSIEQPVAATESSFADSHHGIGSEFLDAWREKNQTLVSNDKYSLIYEQARKGKIVCSS